MMLYKQHPHRGRREGRVDGVGEEEGGVNGGLKCTEKCARTEHKQKRRRETFVASEAPLEGQSMALKEGEKRGILQAPGREQRGGAAFASRVSITP